MNVEKCRVICASCRMVARPDNAPSGIIATDRSEGVIITSGTIQVSYMDDATTVLICPGGYRYHNTKVLLDLRSLMITVSDTAVY